MSTLNKNKALLLILVLPIFVGWGFVWAQDSASTATTGKVNGGLTQEQITKINDSCGGMIKPDPNIFLDPQQVEVIVARCQGILKEFASTTKDRLKSDQKIYGDVNQCLNNPLYKSSGKYNHQQASNATEVQDTALITSLWSVGAAIETQTGKSSETLQKICKQISDSRRIQQAFETKTFLDDAIASQIAALGIEVYKMQLLNTVRTGYQVTAGAGDTNPAQYGSFFPENEGESITQVVDEASRIYILNTLPFSGNPYAEVVAEQIAKEKGIIPSYQTLSRDPVSLIFSIRNGNSVGFEKWLDAMMEKESPKNSFIKQYFVAQDQLSAVRDNAIFQYDREREGNFLPRRICTNPSESGNVCFRWVTVTPSSIVQETTAAAINSRLNRLAATDASTDLVLGSEPLVGEVYNFNSGASNYGSPIDNEGDGDYTGPDDDIDGDGIPNKDDPDFGGGTGIKPTLEFIYRLPSLVQVRNETEQNNLILSWATKNADSCRADNNWIGTVSGKTAFVKEEGENLPVNGTLTINLPLPLSPTLLNITTDKEYLFSTSSSDLLVTLSSTTAPSVSIDQRISLCLYRYPTPNTCLNSGTTTVAQTPAQIVSFFKNIVENLSSDGLTEAQKYTWIFENDKININTKNPTYRISCYGSSGSIATAEVKVKR